MYLNTSENEDEIILEYIRRNFRSYLKNINSIDNPTTWQFFADFPKIFKQQYRFLRNQDGLFENSFTGETCNATETKIEQVYK